MIVVFPLRRNGNGQGRPPNAARQDRARNLRQQAAQEAQEGRQREGVTALLGLTWTPGPAATDFWRGLTMRLGYEPPDGLAEGGPNVELVYSAGF